MRSSGNKDLIAVSSIQDQMQLYIPGYQARRDSFANSKVLLPPLLPQFESCLVVFNHLINSDFASYLQSSAAHYPEEKESELPLSGLKYQLGASSLLALAQDQLCHHLVFRFFDLLRPHLKLALQDLTVVLVGMGRNCQKRISDQVPQPPPISL